MAARTKANNPRLQPRIRILRHSDIAIGPGKAELLALVGQTGSIGEAAKRMKMSYMRAWLLIQTMNECFKQPVVATVRGGRNRGGAELTTTGRKALELYEQMEERSLRAIEGTWRRFRQLLRN